MISGILLLIKKKIQLFNNIFAPNSLGFSFNQFMLGTAIKTVKRFGALKIKKVFYLVRMQIHC